MFVCVHHPYGLSFSDGRFEGENCWKQVAIFIDVSHNTTSPSACFLYSLFKTCVSKSDEVGYGDCRHDCDD